MWTEFPQEDLKTWSHYKSERCISVEFDLDTNGLVSKGYVSAHSYMFWQVCNNEQELTRKENTCCCAFMWHWHSIVVALKSLHGTYHAEIRPEMHEIIDLTLWVLWMQQLWIKVAAKCMKFSKLLNFSKLGIFYCKINIAHIEMYIKERLIL